MDARITWYSYNAADPQVRELDPTQVLSMSRSESIFDGQELRFSSTEHLPRGSRLSYKLGDVVREYVVTAVQSDYDGGRFVHTYTAPWSLYYDFSMTYCVDGTEYSGMLLSNVFFRLVQNHMGIDEEFPWRRYSDPGADYPGSDFVLDLEYNEQIYMNTKWNSLVKALSKARHRTDPILAIWPTARPLAAYGSRNCVDDRYYGLGYASAASSPSHWLELGVNVESMSRSVPDADKHMRSWILNSPSDGRKYPNLIDGSDLRYETASPARKVNHLVRNQGEWLAVPKETEYVQNTYEEHEIYNSSAIRNTLREAARTELLDRNSVDETSYTITMSKDAPPMEIGDAAVVVADGLPAPDAQSGSTKMTVLVSGMERDELTGRTTYTLGVPAGQILPKIQKRKGA